MTLRIGDTAPDFTALTTAGVVHFHEWIGAGWAILLSHPADFTPVCTTELAAVAKLLPAFRQRNVKVIGLSTDTISDHALWTRDIEATHGIAINFPIIADTSRVVAHIYGMIHSIRDDNRTVRSVFVIDPAKKIRLLYAYPQSTGRNIPELLRAIDSLQLTDRHPVATPADWLPGDDVLIAGPVSDAEASQHFPNGWRAERSYLRIVPHRFVH
jgi:alkyl hydroperoxide reductase subunit AhpC